MKRLGALIVAIAVLGAILACGGGGATTTSGSTTSSGTTSSESAPAATSAPAQAAKVGDTITQDGVASTVTKVSVWTPGEFDPTPDAGNEYLVVHVKVHNTTSDSQDYNEFEYKLLNGQGATQDQTITSYSPSKELHSGTLAANGTAEGDLIFEVGKADHGAALVWQRGLDSGTDMQWSLGL